MTKYIEINERLYYKNKFVGSNVWFDIVEIIPNNLTEEITWKTLNEIPMFIPNYTVWKVKRGQIIYLDINRFFPTAIKEWKTKDLNLKLTKTYREVFPSLSTIIKFPNSKMSAQYLKEHFNIDGKV